MVHALKCYEFGVQHKYSCRKFVKFNSSIPIISIIGIHTNVFKLMSNLKNCENKN